MKQVGEWGRWIQGQLFLEPPDTKLLTVLTEARRVYERYPTIGQLIEADLDAYGKRLKATRLADEAFADQRDQDALPMDGAVLDGTEGVVATTLKLQVGRPRTPAIVVYLALVFRGLKGSLSNECSWEHFIDSQTVQYFLSPYVPCVPARSTLLTLVNAISESTLTHLHDCQLKEAMNEGLDDMRVQTIDSTAIASNSAWPCDIQLIARSIERAWRLSEALPRWGVAAFPSGWPLKWLPELQSAKVAILLYKGKEKGKKRRLINRFVSCADRFLNWLHREYDKREAAILSCSLCPSQRDKLRSLWRRLGHDLADADILLNYYAHKSLKALEKRTAEEGDSTVLSKTAEEQDLAREKWEKIFSLSDGSAAFIVKGDRHPVFGYKAQFSRSAEGFITAVKVPEGNDADSNQLIPMVKEHIARTGVMPCLVSADDGYASGPHRDYLKTLGIEHVSISGAKGRRQTSEELWNSDLYVQARADRSAVESTIGHAKQSFALRRCHRRGIANVRSEILEKVIAFNFWRLPYVRQQKLAASLAQVRPSVAA